MERACLLFQDNVFVKGVALLDVKDGFLGEYRGLLDEMGEASGQS